MDRQSFLSEISKIRPQSTFLVLQGYRNSYGEVANYNILFHISYLAMLERSIHILEQELPKSDIEEKALNSVLAEYKASADRLTRIPLEESDSEFERFYDDNGARIKGIKLHLATDTLHIHGMAHQKAVILHADRKEVKSSPLTIAKKKYRKMCPASKFRDFKISPDKIESISVNHIKLIPPI